MITKNTTLQALLDIAIQTLPDVDSGETFIVKDLFRGFEWSRIPVGNRSKLGAMFFAYCNREGAQVLESFGKTPQNQQIYRKK